MYICLLSAQSQQAFIQLVNPAHTSGLPFKSFTNTCSECVNICHYLTIIDTTHTHYTTEYILYCYGTGWNLFNSRWQSRAKMQCVYSRGDRNHARANKIFIIRCWQSHRRLNTELGAVSHSTTEPLPPPPPPLPSRPLYCERAARVISGPEGNKKFMACCSGGASVLHLVEVHISCIFLLLLLLLTNAIHCHRLISSTYILVCNVP